MRQPVDAWAFMRVCDEMRTLPACLNSILPVIKKGVIAYNPSEDPEEEKFILDFCQKNTGFIPFKYDYQIIPAGSREYLTNTERERHLDTYYNAALDQIPNGEWMIKIDADQIYDTEKLARLLSMVDERQIVSIARMNLNVVEGKLHLYAQTPYVDPCDHWLLKKVSELRFKMYITDADDSNFEAYELLEFPQSFCKKYGLQIVHTQLITWHFPLLKRHRRSLSLPSVPLERYKEVLDIEANHVTLEMVDKDYVISFLRKVGFQEELS
ncbi:hypothetical protein [Basilea psittacipulmonis]|uniref:Glycosyltransferase 2-like domain-containing protein n=1 Tax=Basilea psittacipulmonis DSM 24701 TaxID=1072685 RepID=A0A077DI38_9BURK|nr:hypothetical protein [Basilea psittacipulmonis]AIL33182.1 hypothetical protein IX83_07645 [Basilea psittacipulmonis DSM 24701]